LNLDINDLLQEMRLAALKAARTYDPAKGANFLTWASYAAKGALSGGTRSLVSGTQNGRQAMVVNYQQIFQEEAGEDAWLDTQVWLEPDAHHRAEDAERKARLKGLMARLDPKDREILRLRLGLGVGGGGLDARAVARRLGLKPAQVLASMGRIMALAQGAAEDLQLAS
jgi:RNA polymerase sigma factor (sigma-70 family)